MIHATLLKGRTLELMARKKNVTFNDIAQYTHFSKTTISRYFNNPDSLTPENQQIISDALDKLNYKENKVAKILANGQTEFVGVLIPSLSMNYYSEMLNQILASYEKYGYMVDYINPNTNEEWGGAGDVAYTKKFAKWIAAESTKTIADEKAPLHSGADVVQNRGPHRPLPYTLLPRTLRSADPGRCN